MCNRLIFFFQAEDGIRDIGVTGVQTCTLPISFALRVDLEILSFRDGVHELDLERLALVGEHLLRPVAAPDLLGEGPIAPRSEERRVGKECRSRWSPYH